MLAVADARNVKLIAYIDFTFLDAYVAAYKFRRPKTRLNHVVIIRQLVNFALSRKMLTTDPLAGLKIKKAKAGPQPCFTREEVSLILANANDKYRAPLTLLAETGMRCGELCALTWEDVDLKRGFLQIRAKDDWQPKTEDQRAIPINPAARAVLEELPRKCQWVVTAPPSTQYPRGDHQISGRRLLQYLKCLLADLGLPGHLHTFRHAFISHALVNGVPEVVVRKWCGHVDAETIKIYTQVVDDISQAAMQRLASANPAPKKGGSRKGKPKPK